MDYQIFVPGGNATALVFGIIRDAKERKRINDIILTKHAGFVEQVGFVETYPSFELLMAGGEFCGNAMRSAVWCFCEGRAKEIKLKVSGCNKELTAGVLETGETWAEMPIKKELESVQLIEDGCYKVSLDGITHLVYLPDVSKKLFEEVGDITEVAKGLLLTHGLLDYQAAGVIFLERNEKCFRIHPCVYVKDVDTMFYETACGSGTVAVGLVLSLLNKSNVEELIEQPSTEKIKVVVKRDSDEFLSARIIGVVKTDNFIYKLSL